ncbi:MAG: hypothetical protein FRX49_04653 [Trebouxia sp. A1-2]|nr:MAG: hypothetical protein FRX49_04653 [Trebouxia sp. A1-2]
MVNRVGDVILATGTLEPGTNTLMVSSLDIIEAWKTSHVGISFVPKLLPSLHPELVQTVPSGHKMHADGSDSSVVPNAKHSPQLGKPPQLLCKYWVNAGKCLRGDACQYRHVQPAQLPELRKGWVAARRRHKQELSSEAGNPHGFDAAKKGQRASVFSDWLTATFGSEVLSQGSGVLDVAGGRGDVSFELQTVRGIRCTLVDPRPQKLSRSQRKWLQHFRQHKPCVTAETKGTSNTALVNCSEGERPVAAGQGNDSIASLHSSPGGSASTAASTTQTSPCAASTCPPDCIAALEHLPAFVSALPPFDQTASDDSLTAGDARTHTMCSDLQDQPFKIIPMDSCSPQPASLEPVPADPQPHPANPQPAPVSPQPATAAAVMSFSRHGPAAAEVVSLTHGPHGEEGSTPTHGSGVQNSRKDLRGSLSQQIQVTTGYQ